MVNEKQSIELEIESVKGLREDLCVVQSALNMYPSGDQKSRVRRIGDIINQLDEMRPLGSNGKHDNRHTDKCGCDVPDREPDVLDSDEVKLLQALADELIERSINITPGSCMYLAGFLVRRAVKEGWSPAYPDPTPEQEVEFLDRIVAGLNIPIVGRQDLGLPMIVPGSVKLYDVNSLYPTEFFSDWYLIPNYSTYEMNSGGQVRNRSSETILDYESLPGKWIRLRSDEGEYKIVSVDELLNEVFGV
ncbi:hypothetical protein QCN32_gp73 [Arthrobacter phage Niktson]|uniref:Uncharacterized protein n=1 Tax=Arthrobacter phage Niktson TaxID=2014347 RepID=A0A218M5P7_9CAUD|nr:hypothetical protein QCN32_gp73 [Arthrobacter phage Niktson]ASD52293.1 hypothetical protein NIKTSON_73 [Arthrobacter phage Niktson]ASD52386.1 hypothetical protein ELEPHANTMAN_73 [Arthrobacter phage ElephantMan]